MLDSNSLNKIICPVAECRRNINEEKLKELLPLEYFEKHNVLKNDRQVALSKGRIFHCPFPNCNGLIQNSKTLGIIKTTTSC